MLLWHLYIVLYEMTSLIDRMVSILYFHRMGVIEC